MKTGNKSMEDYSHFKPTPESSNVLYIAYDDSAKSMIVAFKGNSRYEYKDVPKKVWSDAIKARSIGSFVRLELIGKYTYSKTI